MNREPNWAVAAYLMLAWLGATTSLSAATYFVDQKRPAADNPGTEDKPFGSISQAVTHLAPGDSLLIKAGVYRESVTVSISGTAEKPITIAACPGDEGKVIISGSDAVTGWKREVGVLFSAPWTTQFDAHYPTDWADFGPYAKRCEMVFVAGKPLTQVLAQGLIRRGTFFVDENKGRLFVALHDFGGPGPAEVAARQRGLFVRAAHLRINGLTVTRVANAHNEAAFDVLGNSVELHGDRAEWNNLDGFRLCGRGIEAYDCVANNNGRCGISGSFRDSLVQGCTTNGNSWRFGPEWHAGGMKIVGGAPSGNRIIRHTSCDNNGRGIWFDYGCKNNRVEQCVVDNNLSSGIEFEACLAENWIVNCLVTRTRIFKDSISEHGTGAGILLYESAGTHVLNNTVVNNERCGLLIAGGLRKIHYDNSEAVSVDTQVRNNIFAGNADAAIQFWVWDKSADKDSLASHRTDFNLFFPRKGGPVVIRPPNARALQLADWQKEFGQDAHSLQADPKFVDADKADYRVAADSPAAGAATPMPDVAKDLAGRDRPKDKPSLGAFEPAKP